MYSGFSCTSLSRRVKYIQFLKNCNAFFYNSFTIFHKGVLILSIKQARNRTGKMQEGGDSVLQEYTVQFENLPAL